ncbi:hypothetical protein [Luteibacter sp.]|jgi:hypothetical protein|uniref:hypothetical protein n=1 Tax=Luteibacter sp. TaxID=1886636 RepID=UPI002F40D30D
MTKKATPPSARNLVRRTLKQQKLKSAAVSESSADAIKAMYTMSSRKGLRLLKEGGIVTPKHKLARVYR